MPLLNLCLKIPGAQETHEFGRVLYILGIVYASEGQYIKSEGLFRAAIDFYGNRFGYESVEAMALYAKVLGRVDIRKSEAESYDAKAKEAAKKMPYWYPYMVNLIVPELTFDN